MTNRAKKKMREKNKEAKDRTKDKQRGRVERI